MGSLQLEHTCSQFDDMGGRNTLEYDEEEKEWVLYLDCHCCMLVVHYCPACGQRLPGG